MYNFVWDIRSLTMKRQVRNKAEALAELVFFSVRLRVSNIVIGESQPGIRYNVYYE